jgi:hypothetical protein
VDSIKQIHKEIILIKQSLLTIERNSSSIGDWLPRKAVMRFFDYADNQLRVMERENALEVSKVGRRKIYSLKSILNLLEKSKK